MTDELAARAEAASLRRALADAEAKVAAVEALCDAEGTGPAKNHGLVSVRAVRAALAGAGTDEGTQG